MTKFKPIVKQEFLGDIAGIQFNQEHIFNTVSWLLEQISEENLNRLKPEFVAFLEKAVKEIYLETEATLAEIEEDFKYALSGDKIDFSNSDLIPSNSSLLVDFANGDFFEEQA